MRKLLIVPTLALSIAAASAAAYASNDDNYGAGAPRDQWMSTAQITQKLQADGYEVRRVKQEGNGYEVYAIARDGSRVEAHVNPVTGDLMRNEIGENGETENDD